MTLALTAGSHWEEGEGFILYVCERARACLTVWRYYYLSLVSRIGSGAISVGIFSSRPPV